MATLRIPTAPVFRPLLTPARYKGAYGGRGSGKSHFFGELMVEECLMAPGTLAVCIREVQKSLMQSSKRLIESKIQSLGVSDQFKILHDRIITPGDGLIISALQAAAPQLTTTCRTAQSASASRYWLSHTLRRLS
jgi:phage terminase large subunit